MARTHEVVLLGKKYKLRSTHSDEYLAELAAFVAERVAEVQRKGSTSTLDAALLAALNIADDYHRLKKDAEERLAAIGDRTQSLLAALDEDAAATPGEAVVDDPPEDAEPLAKAR